MATVTGAMSTTNVLSDQLAIDLSNNIAVLEPNIQPLLVFTRAMGKESATNPEFGWLEETSKARFAAQSGGATDTIATIAVSAGQGLYFTQWDTVLNTRTGEMFRVDGVSTDTLSVTRGVGSTAAAMLNGDELMLIGNAQPEGDRMKVPHSDVPSKVTNYTQIWREPFQITGTLEATSFQVNPNEWDRQMQNHNREHHKDIEYGLNFGRKSATTPGSTKDRTTGGLLSFITTNQTDAGGDLSEAEWNAALQQNMRYGSGKKLAMCSGTGLAALGKFPASKQQTKNDETTYGMNVTRYQGPFGAVHTVWHRLYEGTKYGGIIVLVDMEEVRWRPLENSKVSRDTKLLTQRQDPGEDSTAAEYLTEGGLKVGQQRKHSLISGITS